jgi:hypothetical protein
MKKQDVHLLDARRRLGRDLEHDVGVLRRGRAAARPRTTFGERPLVEKPMTTSPPRTKPRTCRSNTSS